MTTDNFNMVAGHMDRFARDTYTKGAMESAMKILKAFQKSSVADHMITGKGRKNTPDPERLTVRSKGLAEAVLGTGQNKDAHIEKVWMDAGGVKGVSGVKKTKKLPYPVIHEKGGTIRAKNSPYLVFRTHDGQWVRTKEVNMPPRPYIEPGKKTVVEAGIPKKIFEATAEKYIRSHGMGGRI